MNLQILTPEARSNYRHLYADIFWFGVLAGSTMAFLAVYATRLGATGIQIGLLTAGPALINLFFSLPSGRWLEGRSLIRATLWSAVSQRIFYLSLIPLPVLLAPHLQIWMIVLITLVMSVPGTLVAIGFNSMLADVVEPEHRAEVVGRRNALVALSLASTALLCGFLLDWVIFPFPLNYQIVFGIGAVGAGMSTYHLGKVRKSGQASPTRAGRPIGDLSWVGRIRFGDAFRQAIGLRFLTRSSGKPLLRLDLLRTSFGPFLGAYMLFYTFQYLTIPIFPLAYVHQLNLTDSAISLGSSLFHIFMFFISLRMAALSARFGHRRLTVVGAILYGLYPLLLGLAQNATLFWVASITGGVIWGVTSAAMINRLMEKAPQEERPAFMALHNLALNIGILAGSLAGPLLAEWIGVQDALLVGAGLRFLAGFLLVVWG